MDIYVKLTKTTHQIWSCHVTLTSNSKNIYFLPNYVQTFREQLPNLGKLAKEQKSYRQKHIGVEKSHPPVLIGLIPFEVIAKAKRASGILNTL